MKRHSIHSRDNSPPETFSGASVLRHLPQKELFELLDQLKYYSRKHYYGPLDHDDLATEALTQTLQGRRTWNSRYSPLENLCLILRSIASNQLAKDRKTVQPFETNDYFHCSTDGCACSPSPEEAFEANELKSGAETEAAELLAKATLGDSLLERIVASAIEDEQWKPRKISSELNISTSAVHAARRRLKRRLIALMTQNAGNL